MDLFGRAKLAYMIICGLIILEPAVAREAPVTRTPFGQQPADTVVRIFPGAAGYGSGSRGAYAGPADPVILTVDTLDGGNFSTGPDRGTLKWCLSQNYPRIVVFEVGGLIDWSSNANDYYGGIRNSFSMYSRNYCTVYGQTAPSPGITITEGGLLFIQCHDILIQHLRFRFNDTPDTWGKETTCIGGWSGNSNIVIDHCSLSWSIDQLAGFNPASDITYSNNIFAEPLDCNTHPGAGDECHGFFVTLLNIHRFSSIRNIYTNGHFRAPFFNGVAQDLYIANNLMNNIRYYGIYIRDEYSDETLTRMDVVNNYFRPGPNTSGSLDQLLYIRDDVNPGAEIYLSGNYHPSTTNQTGTVMVRNEAGVTLQTTAPVTSSEGYIPIPAAGLVDTLLETAGAYYWDRDSTDIRVLQDVINGSGTLVDSCSQLDDLYLDIHPSRQALTLPANPNEDSGNGYTNLEMWAASFPLSQTGAFVPADRDLSENSVNIYPNPSGGDFTIECASEADVRIRITDINGRVVYDENYATANGKFDKNISITNRGKGMFFIGITSGNKTYNRKIIIE